MAGDRGLAQHSAPLVDGFWGDSVHRQHPRINIFVLACGQEERVGSNQLLVDTLHRFSCFSVYLDKTDAVLT